LKSIKLNLSIVIIFLFVGTNVWVESKNSSDSELKKMLIENSPFCYFKFDDDNFFSYGYRTWGGDGFGAKGKYSIQNGVISFYDFECTNGYPYREGLYGQPSQSLDLNGKYIYSSEIYNFWNKGALKNIETGYLYWSDKDSPENVVLEYDGIKCYAYHNSRYILINENLKMRKKNSLKSDVVVMRGYYSKIGCVENDRKVVYAGDVIDVIAKSISSDTIDGINAPWYLVYQGPLDDLGEYVWIFGGYVKEYDANEIKKEKIESQYYSKLKESIIAAGGKIN
jgi:hypothetical protein